MALASLALAVPRLWWTLRGSPLSAADFLGALARSGRVAAALCGGMLAGHRAFGSLVRSLAARSRSFFGVRVAAPARGSGATRGRTCRSPIDHDTTQRLNNPVRRAVAFATNRHAGTAAHKRLV